MCTRYITPDQRAAESLVSQVPPWWAQRYDVHVKSDVPVVLHAGKVLAGTG